MLTTLDFKYEIIFATEKINEGKNQELRPHKNAI